ncbi:MAG TPA: zinc ribbon domain-containing protein [Firmicutes bacterium]|nr:zinc ribbon domain-containing protein [Candidatus Fermentithermobacillaceae bacterium]
MPIYEYKCGKCGVFEVMQKITDEPLKTCPKCGGTVSRVIGHNVAVIFKGSGFYTTDNRSKEYKDKAKQDSGETKAADS